MTDPKPMNSPDGVLVSTDAGTPSAVPGGASADALAGLTGALEALEFGAVLELVAGFAAGPLGAARVRARVPLADQDQVQEELARVEELARLVRSGKGMVAELVPELGPALSRLRIPGSVLDGLELLALRRTLVAGRLVAAELRRIAPDAPRMATLAVPEVERIWERCLEQALDDDGAVRDSASAALAAARGEIRGARDRLIHKLEVLLRGLAGDGAVTVRDGRYVIPVPRDLRHRPEGIIHGESASGATLFLEPSAVIPLANALRESEAAAVREELKVLRDLTELLRPAGATISALHALCVTVDDHVARARWAAQVDGHAPLVAPAPAPLRLLNARHPLLLAERDGRGPVIPFDLVLEPGERTVLLSGPNTGGKSVLLKAVGLAAMLTQCGIIPPLGPGSALPLFRRVFADIGDRQSIAANLSTFSAHLAELRRILEQADAESLVLLDEVGSGTDPAEGAALAAAALTTLTRRGAVTLATTHLGALKRLATATPGIVNASLQFDAATLTPSYRFVPRVPGRSYGLAIARRLGLPSEVLAEAESQVPEAERSLDALLAVVEERERELVRREQELTELLAANEAEQERLAALGAAHQVREKSLRERERGAEREALKEARQYLLEARRQVEEAVARAEQGGDAAAREARRAVEEAAAGAAAALRRLDADPAGGAAAVALSPGTRVRLDSGSAGEVLELRGDGKALVRVGSLKLVVDPVRLTVLPAGTRLATAASRPGPAATAEASAPCEVDLRGLTGDEAEQVVLAALDAAVLAEHPFLRIIHGKGTGVVRERVRRVLEGDRRVRTHAFAPPNQGGSGVTVAEFSA
jgi:DNA mismatch repair protein MutS2